MVMGRGSDTRLYNPRSESDKMYSSANEDETKYNPASPEYNEQKAEEKKRKEEEKKANRGKIKHIKIRASQGLRGEESPVAMDDSNKRDEEREIGLTGGPPGSRGNLLDLATGAKTGTGSAMTGPLPIAMSEPMNDAWSSLLKETRFESMYGKEGPGEYDFQPHKQGKYPFDYELEGVKCRECGEISDDPADMIEDMCLNCKMKATSGPKHASEPMENAWSSLLKEDDHEHDLGDLSNEGVQRYFDEEVRPEVMNPDTPRPYAMITNKRLMEKIKNMVEGLEPPDEDIFNEWNYRYVENDIDSQGSPVSNAGFDRTFQDIKQSEPMKDAWSTLLKASLEDLIQERDRLLQSGLKQEAKQFDYVIQQMMRPNIQEQQMLQRLGIPTAKLIMPELEGQDLENIGREMMYEGKQNPDYIEMQRRMGEYDPQMKQQFMRNVSRMARRMPQIDDARQQAQQSLQELQMKDPSKFFADEEIMASEPMKDAWSDLLKRETPRTIANRRKQEARQEFRPSTGQFNRPPGGMDPVGATMRRFKARMRGIKGGKKTGLMLPHLAVEMSHRGIATKQPMSKDPQRYRAYQGQSEARKILGNVRTTFSPHARFAQRSNYAGPTGAGRLGGLLPQQKGMMRQPSLRPLRVRAPQPPRPPMMPPMMPPQLPPVQSSVPSMPAPPSSIMMSEDRTQSDILKAKNFARHMEMLNLMRRLIAAKEREAKLKKAMQGGGSAFENGHVPDHPAGVQNNEDEDEKNDGPTQNLETNSSRMGLDPAGILISRRGHMG